MASFKISNSIFGGKNIDIVGGVVRIDGKRVKIDGSDTVSDVVEIKITEGVLESLKTDASVSCGSVTRDVHAGGHVQADNIGGNVNAGGSVNCDDIGGSVNARGSINANSIRK